VHTFGKAVGYRGAVIVGTHQLREYLVNFARPFIYSTAFDLVSLWYVETAYTLMSNAETQRAALAELIAAYHSLAGEFSSLETLQTRSPIQAVIVPTNRAVVGVERALAQEGIFAKAIRSPTVPAGRERIRLCLHSFNTQDDVRRVFDVLSRAVRSEVAHG
jgi:8-amino-7-oxononanoate synthase